jgi:RNA polymerase sigma-70 factor (ECF subfamily)
MLAANWLDITRRFAAGDSQAFAQFYDTFFDLMYCEACRLSGRDESTCLDLVHESMLKAIRSIRPTESDAQLRAWCRSVVKSVTYDWLRREMRTRSAPLESMNELDHTESESLEREARWRWIEEQIQKEPADLQRLFALRYRWGWTLERIARRLGVKTGAVDGKLRRAIEQLRAKAQEEF